MEDKLVSYKTAKLAKEKGFKEKCLFYYEFNECFEEDEEDTLQLKILENHCIVNKGNSTPYYNLGEVTPNSVIHYFAYPSSALKSNNKQEELDEKEMSYLELDDEGIIIADAPTQSLLQKWLREKHSIHINIGTIAFNKGINKMPNYGYCISSTKNHNKKITNYEEALEEGLYEALKFIE